MKKLIALLLASTALLANPVLADKNKCEHHWKSKQDHMKKMQQQLNLTDQQKESIKQIKQASKEEKKQLHTQMRELRKQMKAVTMQDNFDEAQAQQLAEQKSSIMKKMMMSKLRAKQKIYALLTPEQKTQYQEMMKKKMEKMEKMRKYQ